jgi:hypothetical protein
MENSLADSPSTEDCVRMSELLCTLLALVHICDAQASLSVERAPDRREDYERRKDK